MAKGYWIVFYRSISEPSALEEYVKIARGARLRTLVIAQRQALVELVRWITLPPVWSRSVTQQHE
jgi:hypothetical protein